MSKIVDKISRRVIEFNFKLNHEIKRIPLGNREALKINSEVDVEFEKASIPFFTNSINNLYACHILEYVRNYIPFIEELWRIMKDNATFTVIVSNNSPLAGHNSEEQLNLFTCDSFDIFDKRTKQFKENGWCLTHARFKIINLKLTRNEIIFNLKVQKKRILFIAPPSSPHIVRWRNSILFYGYNLNIASRRIKGISNLALGDDDSLDRVEKFKNIPRNLALILQNKKFEVVHAHFSTCYGHALSVVPNGIMKVLSVWGEDVLEESRNNPLLNERLLCALDAASLITTTSVHMKRTLINLYFVNEKKIAIVPWGYNNNFHKKKVTAATYSRFGLSSELPIIISARVCRKQNNIVNIVEAFLDSDLKAQLVILTGELSDQSYLQTLRSKTNLDVRIKYLNTLAENDLADLYNISEAIISIPYVDQLSTTILEALACGTPIICSDITVYHERIIMGKNGVFVNPDNPPQIRNAITYFVDKSIKEMMSSFAINSVKGDSWEANFKSMMILYDIPLDLIKIQ